jgi:hypothetical protein
MPEPSESALGPHFGGWNGGATQNDRAGGGADYSDISQDSHAHSLQHRITNSWQSDEVRPHAYDACFCFCFCFSVSVAHYPWLPAVIVVRHGVANR